MAELNSWSTGAEIGPDGQVTGDVDWDSIASTVLLHNKPAALLFLPVLLDFC
jgi:hypothetical protein